MKRKSPVWNYFNLDKTKSIGECKQCGKQLKYNKSTSSFIRHATTHGIIFNADEDFDEDNATSDNQRTIDEMVTYLEDTSEGGKICNEFNNYLASMIVSCGLPFKLVEHEAFKLFIKKISPRMKLPGRRTIANIIDGKYERIRDEISIKLMQLDSYSITFDAWTEPFNNQGYLGATVHFIFADKLQSHVIAVRPLKESHTASNIERDLESIISDWSLDKNKLTCCVTDNGANMKLAVKNFIGKDKHVACYAHSLNLLVKDIIDSDEEFKGSIKKVKDIVSYFHHSSKATQLLRQAQIDDDTSKPLKLKASCPTRWNSLYLMVERFLHLQVAVFTVLTQSFNSIEMPSHSEIQLLTESLQLFKPFLQATIQLSAEKVTTISKAIPISTLIYKSLNNFDPVHHVALKLKQNAIKFFEKRFIPIESSHLHVIATLLDPRFKSNDFTNIVNIGSGIAKLNRELNSIGSQTTTIEPVDENDGLWALRAVQQSEDLVVNEKLQLYLNSPLSPLNSCPITMWNNLKHIHPKIAKLAFKYMSIPATSVPSERIFSKAGLIVNKLRSNLDPKRVEKLVILMSQETELVFSS